MLRYFLRYPFSALYSLFSEYPLRNSLIGVGIGVAVLLYYFFKVWKKKQPMGRLDLLIFSLTLMFLQVFYISLRGCTEPGYIVGS